jgi:hypothetical protein
MTTTVKRNIIDDCPSHYRLTIETTAKKDIKKGEKIKIILDDKNGVPSTKILSNKPKYLLKK